MVSNWYSNVRGEWRFHLHHLMFSFRQNSVTELYSLFKFLRVKPFNDWERFNASIAKPVTSGRGAGAAMKRLQVVLRKIMLRRTKTQTLNGEALVKLPKRIIEVVPCEFNGSERAFYTSLETKMEAVLEKLVQSENRNYFSVLLLLLRLRQGKILLLPHQDSG